MPNPIESALALASATIDQYPQENRYNVLSAIQSEPRPFYDVMAKVLLDTVKREGKLVRPLCTGIVGAMLMGNYSDGGYLYNPGASVGEDKWSKPGWLGDEEGTAIQRYAVMFIIYGDEAPLLRAAAALEGITIVDEIVFKSTVTLEQH